MSSFFGFYGYYYEVRQKYDVLETSRSKICYDHPDERVNRGDRFCAICGKELELSLPEKEPVSFYDYTEEGHGNLTKSEIKKLYKTVGPFFGDWESGFEILIPQSSKVFGFYFDSDDDDKEMKPPKVASMTETRKMLAEDMKFLRKYFEKVSLKFGFLSDWG